MPVGVHHTYLDNAQISFFLSFFYWNTAILIHLLSVAASELKRQSLVVEIETTWTVKPKIPTSATEGWCRGPIIGPSTPSPIQPVFIQQIFGGFII